MSIHEKILNVQQNMIVPKSLYSAFGDFYFRRLENILSVLKPLLAKEKLLMTFDDCIVNVEERFYVKSTVTLIDVESKEELKVSGYAREAEEKTKMDAAQLTVSTSSYARKLALDGLFLTEDDDSEPKQRTGVYKKKTTQSNKQASKNGKISEDEIASLFKQFSTKEEQKALKDTISLMGLSSTSQIMKKDLNNIITKAKNLLEKDKGDKK